MYDESVNSKVKIDHIYRINKFNVHVDNFIIPKQIKIYDVKGQIMIIPYKPSVIQNGIKHYCSYLKGINKIKFKHRKTCINNLIKNNPSECIELDLLHNIYECNRTLINYLKKNNIGLY